MQADRADRAGIGHAAQEPGTRRLAAPPRARHGFSAPGQPDDTWDLDRRPGSPRCSARPRGCRAPAGGLDRNPGGTRGSRETARRYKSEPGALPGSGRSRRGRLQARAGFGRRSPPALPEPGQQPRPSRSEPAAGAGLCADGGRAETGRRHVPDAAGRAMGSGPGWAANAVAPARGHLLLAPRVRVQLRDAVLDVSSGFRKHHDAANAPRVDHRQRQERAVCRRARQSRPASAHRKVITMDQMTATDSRVEIAGVLVLLQASFSLVAGLSAIPFGIVEPGFRVLSVVTILVAAMMFWLARNLRRGRRWAWRWLVLAEVLSLTVTVLLALLPIGTIRGPVPVLVNLVIPWAVLVLLASGSSRSAGPRPGPADPA